ncbi:MAG: Rieske 2Fe-2S domain-containing protein [Minwuiales bacterium]|nr:Rieske 2Fe-2S domain-containing protein [Minwuiales bacterium]
MQQSEQVAQLKKLLHYLDTRTTAMADDVYRNNVTDYTDPEQLKLEQNRLFRHHPLFMGLSCRAEKPGDYFTDDYSGVPILVVRDRSGTLNAFINTCRHRGAKVVDGCGGARAFSCPYHAWTYGLDGRLMSRPHEEAFEGMDKAEHGLVPLPVVEKYGMIWVGATPGETFDIDEQLGGLGAEMAAYGLGSYSHYETRTSTQPMNWKLVLDTFLESYHINVLHVKTIDPILHSNLGTFDGYGRNLRMIIARRTLGQLREQPEQEWDLMPYTAVVYILFPNTVFVVQGDHLETWHIYPSRDNPNESQMMISLYTPEPAITDSAKGHWDRNFDLLMRTVEDEDFPLGSNVQRGFHAGAQTHITFGRNEPSLAHFHRSIKQALGLAAA